MIGLSTPVSAGGITTCSGTSTRCRRGRCTSGCATGCGRRGPAGRRRRRGRVVDRRRVGELGERRQRDAPFGEATDAVGEGGLVDDPVGQTEAVGQAVEDLGVVERVPGRHSPILILGAIDLQFRRTGTPRTGSGSAENRVRTGTCGGPARRGPGAAWWRTPGGRRRGGARAGGDEPAAGTRPKPRSSVPLAGEAWWMDMGRCVRPTAWRRLGDDRVITWRSPRVGGPTPG